MHAGTHYYLDEIVTELLKADVNEKGERKKQVMDKVGGVRITDATIKETLQTLVANFRIWSTLVGKLWTSSRTAGART